jgi:hypothetical protein
MECGKYATTSGTEGVKNKLQVRGLECHFTAAT